MQVTCRADLSLKSPDHYIIPLPKKKCPHFCKVLKCSSASFELSRLCKGSQILSESGYPFHFTKNFKRLYLFHSIIICSTSYSLKLSTISGGSEKDHGNIS